MKKENRIRIIYYSSISEPSSERLLRIVEMNFTKSQIEICRTIDELLQRLEQPLPELFSVVLHMDSREELTRIVVLRDLVVDRRIILVLPDDEPATTSLGHTLRPRFITYRNSDYADVAVVLARMIKSIESSCQGNILL
ncbi:MAG: hypothetical protein ACOYOS_07905 [Syntrophales bacterium]